MGGPSASAGQMAGLSPKTQPPAAADTGYRRQSSDGSGSPDKASSPRSAAKKESDGGKGGMISNVSGE